ncbi:hypothetical protein C7B64_10790 [Merismopedia glauca CCAP 1448/3]|uniref:Uncharacterized protein n=1 Tax=Merismopedia glauca CCAP 1448/3 TaxID=1296344 RepID=A0A2T1C451_9CYAN|nr:hypothetical protein C7B64_10790 [Merismopedia glauca CCAP 1448/3]
MDLAERIESLKAGLLGAIAVGITFTFTVFIHQTLTVSNNWVLPAFPSSFEDLSAWVREAVAFGSGFLFGVTYRYIIRQGENPHLKSGAVMAFGLVRGLAQIESISDRFTSQPWLAFVLLGESAIVFAVAAASIDLAIAWRWIKPAS